MPVYPKKGRGRDVWRVVIWAQGRSHERVVKGKKSEAEAFEARERVRLEELGAPAEARTAPTFSAFCVERYRPHAETHLRASTWKVRQYQLATLIEYFGQKKLTAFTTEDVERYKTHRRKAGIEAVSVNNELAVLQAVFAYARKLPVPASKFTIQALPVRGRGRPTAWTDAQIAALFAAVETHSPAILPIVVFLANTGCRKGEALALERRNVLLEDRMIRIWPSEEWQPKDNEPREIPIGDALLPWLTAAKHERWVFPSADGDRFAYWPKLQFDRARKRAGHEAKCKVVLEDADADACSCGTRVTLAGGPHQLRHTFASHFLKAQPDLFLLSKILGHSETRTTKLYSHLLPDHLARARNVVNLAPGVGPATLEAKRRWSRG